ncbi:DNA-binding protein [Xanthomonas campestris]|uniref:DNA-binding protein n=1 Tax=Xanthomonas campestris TaxID=339 RepID=UPI002B238183|nr:DNA-binding protein [Xanthomonas campestris]MEA9776912.1 DNA-binding protein [Xanthomonas campestris pv. raphani]
MAVTKITKDQIWLAADELDAAGMNPTLAAVRKAVGGGSYTTIQEHLAAWKERRAAKEMPQREPIPATLQERSRELAEEIWMAAIEVANARLSVEREALERARAELDVSRAEAAQFADQLTEELEDGKARIMELEQCVAAERAEGAGLRERLAAMDARAHEQAEQLAAARAAEQEARAAMAAAREESAGLRGQIATLERQSSELMASISRVVGKPAS